MDIDDLTLRQVKELQAVFGRSQADSYTHPDIGKKVIIRTYSAGVHFGTLHSKRGNEVILHNAIRIWHWQGAFTLSSLAMIGTSKPSECKFAMPVDSITLEMVEIIPCSSNAVASIEGVKPHEG